MHLGEDGVVGRFDVDPQIVDPDLRGGKVGQYVVNRHQIKHDMFLLVV